MTVNTTFDGHKLLITTHWQPTQAQLDHLHAQFPGLVIKYHVLRSWADVVVPQHVQDEFKDATILLTGRLLPERSQAPKLAYVQLVSAGLNRITEQPLFAEPKVHFANA